jgi:uncharacterized coiled-coil DUF342 family protein
MSERDAYVAKMKAKLDEWNAEIQKFEARAGAASAEAKLKYEQQVAELKARRDEAARKLRELQDAGAGAWESLREGTEAAWSAMAKAFKDAAARFR